VMPFTLTALIGVVMLSQPPARSQAPGRTAVSAETARAQSARDSNLARTERAYREILEKTNAQLGLWTNPYGVMIGALGVLFTVGAIVAGFVIFRQGRDYRDLIAESIAEYQKILNAFIEDKNQQIEVWKADAARQVAELRKGLDDATGKQKQEIAAKITELEKLQAALKPQDVPRSTRYVKVSDILGNISPSTFASIRRAVLSTTQHKCSRCGTSYDVPVQGLIASRDVTCPQCRQVDQV